VEAITAAINGDEALVPPMIIHGCSGSLPNVS
jgi:hypothetical protein